MTSSESNQSIFNTVFETSLRILLILNESEDSYSCDRIMTIDFTAIYGKDFGISDYNLHGDSYFRYGEFPARRDLVTRAVKDLVIKELIKPSFLTSGFTYKITPSGKRVVKSLKSVYSKAYKILCRRSIKFYEGNDDKQALDILNSYAKTFTKAGI